MSVSAATNLRNISTDSSYVQDGLNKRADYPVPIIGIVLPLVLLIPIVIGLGLSFRKFHQRRKALNKKQALFRKERRRINAPSAAIIWEVEFTNLYNTTENKNARISKETPKAKGSSAQSKYEISEKSTSPNKYNKNESVSITVTSGDEEYDEDVHRRTNNPSSKWVFPRGNSTSDFETMPVISKHEIKYNSKQNDSPKRKLIDLSSLNPDL